MKKAGTSIAKTRNKQNEPPRKLTSVSPDLNQDKAEEGFRFGGIPNRDFKKNLGCG